MISIKYGQADEGDAESDGDGDMYTNPAEWLRCKKGSQVLGLALPIYCYGPPGGRPSWGAMAASRLSGLRR